MRKIWVPALALASAALGYSLPHSPEQLTLIKFRDRAPSSVQLPALLQPSTTSMPQPRASIATTHDSSESWPDTSALEHQQRLANVERELTSLQLEHCESENEDAGAICTKLVHRLAWENPDDENAKSAAMSLYAKCVLFGKPTECVPASTALSLTTYYFLQEQTEVAGCEQGDANSCYNGIYKMPLRDKSEQEIFEFAQMACRTNDLTFCDSIANRSYSAVNFQALKEAPNQHGLALMLDVK